MTTQFSSEGFDLDAIPADNADGSNVVLEVGGGASTLTAEKDSTEGDSLISKSEQCKARGNELFQAGNYLDAYDCYTDAMENCPGMSGKELLEQKLEFDEKERAKAYAEFRKRDEDRKKEQREKGHTDKPRPPDSASAPPLPEFVPPPHDHGKQLSTYYSNRAACCLHLQRNEDAIDDCTIALLLQPSYVKALVRRMTAYERMDKYEEALKDAAKVVDLDPSPKNRRTLQRIQKLHDKQLEELKEKTMGQLKELGNSLLGNFGLSLDNFNAVKDPNTGSYSISFNQNK